MLGIGTVGGEVARRITAGATTFSSGVELSLAGILDRRPEKAFNAGLDPALLVTEGQLLVDDPDIDVIVETLGGEQPAAEFMSRSLAQGKHVVTANKEAVSKNLPALIAAAEEGNAAFLFEASIGGGIPLVVSLRQILSNNSVTSVRGILNGTTNFILHKMETDGSDYSSALAEAQQLGYAEANPTADVEGFDAVYKLAILSSLITGTWVHPDQVDRTGITGVSLEEMAEARERGGTIRLIAEVNLQGDEPVVRVAPQFVSQDDLFSRVVANYNAIEIVGDVVGPVWLHGQGAGPSPTSSAVIGDIVEAVNTGSAATPRLRL